MNRTYLTIMLMIMGALLHSQDNHIVQPEETLYSLSLKYDIGVEELKAFNGLESSFIKAGDELRIPPTGEDHWVVKRGDSLSLVAFESGCSLEDLKRLNRLEGETIRVGQILKLPPAQESPTYEVEPGDSLWSIASRNNTTIDVLNRLNGLTSPTLVPGMLLRLPFLETALPEKQGISILKALLTPGWSPEAPPEWGPWFHSEPEARTQPTIEYGELSALSTTECYDQARETLAKLNREIDRAGKLSRRLKGWTVIVDPGHGGLDPGAVVESRDGMGNKAIVVEDEYAYDISVRVYALLQQHGADVHLTVISPNHHIRHTPDASLTFVNEKNEVYNSSALNSTGAWSEWPVGGSEGLSKRLKVARDYINYEGNKKSLFLSIHCDNTPGGFLQSGILTWGETEEEKEQSRLLASSFDQAFPSGLDHKDQEVFVLKNNPASRGAVLVEIRNVHYDNNSWALRNEDLRDADSQKIVDSLLHFVEKN